MDARHQSLTDKEKQTLRLLLQGYDAKTMAQHLGLSVHTINERLRDARRKMATSSSREAARLLHAAEAQMPNLLADKALGDASTPPAGDWQPQPVQGSGPARRAGWFAAGIAMSLGLALIALSSLSEPAPPPARVPATAVVPTPATEAAAVAAARQFLALIDRDNWTASWQATHTSFRLLNTVDWWTDASRRVREKVGTIRSRGLARVDFTAAPPHGQWQVAFKASYSKKPDVTETLSLAYENGEWKVVGIAVD